MDGVDGGQSEGGISRIDNMKSDGTNNKTNTTNNKATPTQMTPKQKLLAVIGLQLINDKMYRPQQ